MQVLNESLTKEIDDHQIPTTTKYVLDFRERLESTRVDDRSNTKKICGGCLKPIRNIITGSRDGDI